MTTIEICGIVFVRDFFGSVAEADEWLAFDTIGEELERLSYHLPDQFGEWQHWRQAWLDKEVELVVDSEVITP